KDIVVQLLSSKTSRVTVPATVTLKAGQTSANFNLTIVDNAVIDGTQNVTVIGSVEAWTSGMGTIAVDDNDATITVTMPASGWEGQTLTSAGTVKIGGTLASNLVVNLLSDDTTEVTVPSTVTILAGQTTATFTLTLLADGLKDGTQTAQITASATGLTSGNASIVVHDANLDHVTFDTIAGPKTAAVAFSATARAFNIANEPARRRLAGRSAAEQARPWSPLRPTPTPLTGRRPPPPAPRRSTSAGGRSIFTTGTPGRIRRSPPRSPPAQPCPRAGSLC